MDAQTQPHRTPEPGVEPVVRRLDGDLTWHHVELETDRFGTCITHGEDDTGEFVVLQSEVLS